MNHLFYIFLGNKNENIDDLAVCEERVGSYNTKCSPSQESQFRQP